MSNFYQHGVVTVLHRLVQPNVDRLEQELARYERINPVAPVLPSFYAELGSPTSKAIVETLKTVSYLNEIVISLDHASALEFRLTKPFFSVFPQRVRLIWNNGARIQSILTAVVDHNLDIGLQGKGRGCWTAFGHVLARNHSQVIALHDCNITSYSRDYLARLCYPLADPHLRYEFCPGYYSLGTDRLTGRVTRLFITPLLRSLQQLVGPHALLTFLDSFRYPLAGEFAMARDLAWTNRIPGDWGLEIGVLAEVYRNCALRRIGQADIADAYDRTHQELSAHNPDAGLLKICVDITTSVFRNLAGEVVILSDGVLKTLRTTYLQAAQEAIDRYENDAAINSLAFDRHQERTAVEVFLKGMKLATDGFLDDPLGLPMISNWSRVTHAVPDIFDRVINAIEMDHAWDPTSEPAAIPS